MVEVFFQYILLYITTDPGKKKGKKQFDAQEYQRNKICADQQKKSFQRKDNHTQGIEISNGELYAVQQTTGKARIIEEKKRKI